MVITILYILFYILGICVSYISTIIYEYYLDKFQYSYPQVKLKYVKQTFNESFFAPTVLLSWVYLIILLLIILLKNLKRILDKLIEFIVL